MTPSDGRPSSVNMSQRAMLDNQPSGIVDDFTGAVLPNIAPDSRRVDMNQFDFGEDDAEYGSEGDAASDDTEGEEGGNEQIEEIYRQQMQ